MRTLLPLLALAACTIETEPRNVPNTPPAPVTVDPVRPTPVLPPSDVCPEDAYEPNDDVGAAVVGVLDGILSTNDIDRFDVSILPGEALYATAWFDNDDGNLDLYITDVDGVILAASTNDGDSEDAFFLNDTNAEVLVVVETNLYNAGPDACAPYGLEILVQEPVVVVPSPTPPPQCVDDANEPNNDWNGAIELQPAYDTLTVYDNVAMDADWFYVTMGETEEIEVILRHDTPGVQLDTSVSDEFGLLASGLAVDGLETRYVIPATGDVQTIDIYLAPTQPNTCAPYTLSIDSYLLTCAEDLLEPNDVTPVVTTSPAFLTLVENDVDRIAIDVYPGEELFADALFSNANGNVDLELFDAAGLALDWSTSNTDNETVTYFNDTPFLQELMVEVTVFDADLYTCQDVDLEWIIYPPVCFDDALEGDDAAAGAAELIPQIGTSQIYDLIADDDDWFFIETLPGEAVDVFIQHDTVGEELDLTAFDALGQVAYDVANVAGIEAGIALPATFPGVVYELQVRPLTSFAECMPYTLTVVSY